MLASLLRVGIFLALWQVLRACVSEAPAPTTDPNVYEHSFIYITGDEIGKYLPGVDAPRCLDGLLIVAARSSLRLSDGSRSRDGGSSRIFVSLERFGASGSAAHWRQLECVDARLLD